MGDTIPISHALSDRNRYRVPIAVFCSGEGTNLQAILEAARAGRLRARVALVVSDRAEARALRRARRAGVAACHVDPRACPSRAAFERALIRLCERHGVRLVCLAGFMRILSPVFVRRFARRIVNIHPALLPAFPGAHAVRDALAWGAKVTGVTVHFVDEQVDHGPVIAQEALAVRPGETEAGLLRRLHRLEHRLYPRAIGLVLSGRARVAGRTVKIS
jgi:phosphoribosylglycinamide formyltransferase-1